MFNLAALGAGIGQFAQQQQQERENQVRTLMLQMQLRKFQMEMEADRRANEAAGLSFDLGGGGMGAPAAPPPIQGLPQSARPATIPGSAFEGQFSGDPLALIEKYESGGRNVMQGIVPPGGGYNPSVGRVTGPSTAQGYYQITNTTWRDAAPKAGVDLAQFPTAMSAPKEVQAKVAQALYNERGFQPWAPYNPKLAQAISGQSVSPGAPDQAAAQPPTQAEPPPEMPPSVRDIALILRQKNPTASIRAIMERAKTEREGLLSDYKVKHDAWKAKTGFAGDAASRAIQSRKVDVDEWQGEQKISQEDTRIQQELRRITEAERAGTATRSDLEFKQKHAGRQQTEVERANVAREQNAGRQQTEVERANVAREQNAAGRLKATVGKAQAKTDVALTEAENLVKDARELAMMIEADPTLVGGPGMARRAGGAASDVLGAVIGREDPLRMSNPASANFKSKLQLLQSRLGKPLLDARYWSKGEQERMNQLVPALGEWDSPTAARQSLNNIADTLERTVAATRAATGAVAEDVNTITEDEIKRGLPEIFGTQ